MSNLLVREVLRGQEIIDKRRNEIKQLISMVVGLVSAKDVQAKRSIDGPRVRIKSQSQDFIWLVDLAHDGAVKVRCISLSKGGDDHWGMSFSVLEILHRLSANDIDRLYVGLDDFLVGMIDSFPGLIGDLMPFIVAGRYDA